MKGMPGRRIPGVILLSSLALAFLLNGCDRAVSLWGSQEGTTEAPTAQPPGIEPSPGMEEPTSVEAALNDPRTFPSVQSRIDLAFRSKVPISTGFDRVNGGNALRWPAMRYLGEPATVLNTTVTPTDMRVVEGGAVLAYYNPQEDQRIDAPMGIPQSLQGQPLPAVMIPPGSSLVMIRMAAAYDRFCTLETAEVNFAFGSLKLSYPALGAQEIQILEPDLYQLGEVYRSVNLYCSENGWAYFLLPGKDLDPSELWLEYRRGTGTEDIVVWTLTERP